MSLGRKLALFLLLAAVAPLAGVGFTLLARVERALAARAAAEQLARAELAAATLAADLGRVEADLDAFLRAWPPGALREAELQRLLALLAQQVSSADAAAIVDGAGSVRAVVDEAGGAARGPGTEAFLAAVRAAGAAAGAGAGQFVVSVYEDPARGPLFAAVRVASSPDGRRWLVSGRLSPELARRRLDGAAPRGGGAYLLDGRGEPLVASSGAAPLGSADRAELAAGLAPGARGTLAGARLVAAFAPVPGVPSWGVLVAVPSRAAYAEAVAMRRGVLGASAAVLAAVLAAAALLARGLGRGLARIEAAARTLGAGDLTVRLPVRGADEVAAVSATFNVMAGELERARGRLEHWNEELQREVDLRSRELGEAHAHLLEARKLAAVGQLGAGVAHEINNPLSGILGNAQLLLEQPRGGEEREVLLAIESLARRCRDITQTLLRFSQQRAAPDFQDVDLNRVVADALLLAEGQTGAAGIPVDVALAEPAPRVRGDPGHLAQVVLNLVANARTACAGRDGARIRVATSRSGAGAELVVADGGKGIAPEHLPRIFEPFFTTKDRWSDVGLGLSVTYRIVSEHGGAIAVDSTPGAGSTFTVRLPPPGAEPRA